MATQSHAQAVKSLNKGAGRRRFVFKTFSQQVEEIDVDVYRSLDPLKPEPSQGSTFFRDCLIEWRELNTAEDFISFHDEMFPLVQTLPQIILQKEVILSQLLSRLDMKARLSLEPILRLIAALSQDLLEDFIPFLQKVAESMALLLSSGGDRESEIIEQVFTCWSCIMMHLQKYLIEDIVHILKVTTKLRFYPKEYIQEFMAESVSFLLRKAHDDQLKRGVKKIMSEVVAKPLDTRKSGASALLFYAMKGFASKFHSRAEKVLKLLLKSELIGLGEKDSEGSNPVVEVLIIVFQRLSEELQPSELKVLLTHEQKEISDSIINGNSLYLSHLLSLFISTMQTNNVQNVIDFEPVLKLAKLLMETFIDQSSEIMDKILQLMLCILDGLHSGNHEADLTELSVQWTPIFKMRNQSFISFIKELLSKDHSILYPFRTCIITALIDLITTNEEEAMYMFIKFFEKIQSLKFCLLEENLKQGISRVCNFLKEQITCCIEKIDKAVNNDPSCVEFRATDLGRMWGVISCYSCMIDFQVNNLLIMDFVEAVDRLLVNKSETIAAVSTQTWEGLIGAGLSAYQKLGFSHSELPVDKFLYFAKRYKSSVHILSSVADFLDSLAAVKKYRVELEASKTIDAFEMFQENLRHSDKRIRLLTLRILCHYESPSNQLSENDMIIDDDSKSFNKSEQSDNVLHSLHAIEATSLSITTSRKVILLISKIQMDLSVGRIPKACIPLVFNAIIGIYHNRFNYLWNPAMECSAVLISHYHEQVWELCMKYLEKCVSNFVSPQEHSDKGNDGLCESTNDLVSCFNAFVGHSYEDIPSPTVLSLLIKSLQKVSTFAESRSRRVIPLFLMFLGYDVSDLSSVRSYCLHASKGKEWKSVLEDWLNLFKSMRNPKSFYLSQFLKDVLQYRLLDENDPELQLKVLDCLLNWKDEYLVTYDQHLRNLVNPKTLRDELTRWSLSRESNLISEAHRDSLVPLVIRILVPKVRKLKTLASRKAASMHHRKAVIAFLAELDINELPLFFALLMKPLQTDSFGVDAVDELLWSSPKTPANFDSSGVLRHFTMENIKSLSSKKIYGFLHVTEEILAVFDESRIKPVLDMLLGSVVRILASCAPGSTDLCVHEENNGEEKQATTSKQLKDLRSLCLKIVSLVLSKFEHHDFSLEFWDIFFSALKPLIDGFKQEGASSEKPSSLFICFLAMSRSHKLVSLFNRAKNLVPDIFSILTISTASEAIISCVLRFIENLLNLDIEVESGDNNVKGILVANIDTLVSSLHQLFTSKSTNRKSLNNSGARELNIFKLLPKYIQDPSLGRQFIDILLPTLTKKHHDWDSCVETLRVIQKMVPMLGNEGSLRILNIISPLLIDANSEVRLAICDNLDSLSESDSSLVHVAKLLREFNTTSAMEIDVLDYDVVIGAYEKINIDFFCSVREEHALVILSHCVHDMSSHDLIMRNSAYRLLGLFIEFCKKILEGELESKTMGCWSETRIQNTINNFFLKYMGDAMNKENSVKKVWIDLLLDMVLKLPKVSNLESLQALRSGHTEQDFFINIVHLQKHRRARALTRFCSVVSSCHLSEVITNKVLVPLFFNMLLEVKDGKGENLRNACIDALASISGYIEWKQYYALLNRCFRELKLKPDRQKMLLRLICAILDHYHFSQVNKDSQESESTVDLVKHDEIQSSLHASILPKIQKLLTLDTENINVNVSLVALKLFKLLPGNVLELHLSTIIHRVSNFLKNRLESVRDEARSALAACLKELGLEYLKLILIAMRSTLKRGFEVHVLGYSLNFILSKCLSDSVCGRIDYCLEELLTVAENDILGDVSEEKEVDKIASKMKETRKKKSFETLKLIAQSITFNEKNALKLLSPVTNQLQKQLTPKLKSKLESMLQHIASGIKCNPTANQERVLIFAYGLIKDHLNSKSSHLITVFALGILHGRIKKMKLKENEEQVLSLLDPFVGLLCGCLSSKFEGITSAAILCLSLVIKVPLPSLNFEASNIENALFDILRDSGNVSTPLAESCIRLMTLLLKNTSIKPSEDTKRISTLLQFPLFSDLKNKPSLVALSLLKVIVKRKVEVTEVFDLAIEVSELMVTSQVELIRKKCSQILLQFLLDYKLGEKRMQQHLNGLLANLRYQHSTGREAVLEMLHAIIRKFPDKIVNEISQTTFLPLVVCLANDSEKKVRSMTGAAIMCLIHRVNSQSQRSIFEFTFSWYSGENQNLWSAAAQVLGLFVEVLKKGFRGHMDAIFPLMRRIFSSASNTVKNIQEDSLSEATIPLWKEAYYSLVLFEKILLQFPELCLKDLEDIWEIISEFLQHPHIWIRNISNRLIALYFSRLTEIHSQNNGKWIGEYFLTRPSRLFLLAASFCSQMKTSLTDDAANKHLQQNIVFSILGLHSMLGQQKEIQAFWSTLEKKDEEILIKAFMILDLRKGRSMYASLQADLNGHCDEKKCEGFRFLIISSLLKKLGKIALDTEEAQMRIVFESFKLIAPQIHNNIEVLEQSDKKEEQSHTYQVLLPLYKICEGFAGKVIADDVKQFAQEVRDSIRDAIGVQNFVQVYSQVRKNLKAKRDKRRQGEKVMAVVNPMRNAKRKLRIAAKHKENKKRKITSMKLNRWMH